LVKAVYAKTPDVVLRIGKVHLPLVLPARTEHRGHMLIDEGLGLVARDRVHVHRLQAAGQAHVAGLVGLDDDVARAAVHGQLEQLVEDFGMRG
jgi:hypothetical protein